MSIQEIKRRVAAIERGMAGGLQDEDRQFVRNTVFDLREALGSDDISPERRNGFTMLVESIEHAPVGAQFGRATTARALETATDDDWRL
jgi:hypothetical protein